MTDPTPPTIQGLPRSLTEDSWWLSAGATTPPRAPSRQSLRLSGPSGQVAATLAALLTAGDYLLWDADWGLSLALFALLVFAAALSVPPAPRRRVGPAILMVASVLPVVEYLQALSVAFLMGGLFASVAWARLGDETPEALARAGLRLMATIPAALPRSLRRSVRAGLIDIEARRRSREGGLDVRLAEILRSWAFPIGGAMILAALMLAANPVLEDALRHISLPRLDLVQYGPRVLFWAGIAFVLMPLLLPLPAPRRTRTLRLPLGLNPRSVVNALVLFNGMLAVQTQMDLVYFWGGMALPEGMSHAEYAHRGAYPLLITATLAGAFALAARPFLAERSILRPLMALWLIQNISLSLSSLGRLWIYVDHYGLTYLRVHAAIWIVLTALWLALIGWQVFTGQTRRWLFLRSAAMGLGTLYVAGFINFASLIASFNTAKGDYDWDYLWSLPNTRFSAIESVESHGWRDWGFRKARVRAYLALTDMEGR